MNEHVFGTERGREILWKGNGEVLKNTNGLARCAAGAFAARALLCCRRARLDAPLPFLRAWVTCCARSAVEQTKEEEAME
jgi:hypothetical protein